MMLCDFHIHSTFSDGKLTIPQIVDLYGSQGFGVIAITDHLCEESTPLGKMAHWLNRSLNRSNLSYYFELIASEAERAWDQYRMHVIPGYELTKNSLINHRSAHVVALGVTEYLSPDQDIYTLLKLIREKNGISIAAHPVCTGKFEPQTYFLWSRKAELGNLFDAWEVASGQEIFDEVLRSPLPKIANSDLHVPGQINSWKTLLPAYANRTESVFDCIRSQNLEFKFFSLPHLQLTQTLQKLLT